MSGVLDCKPSHILVWMLEVILKFLVALHSIERSCGEMIEGLERRKTTAARSFTHRHRTHSCPTTRSIDRSSSFN